MVNDKEISDWIAKCPTHKVEELYSSESGIQLLVNFDNALHCVNKECLNTLPFKEDWSADDEPSEKKCEECISLALPEEEYLAQLAREEKEEAP